MILLGATGIVTSLNTVAKGSKRAEGKYPAPGSVADSCQLLSDQGMEASPDFFLFALAQLEPGELQRQQAPSTSKACSLAEGQPGGQPGK